MITNLSNVSMIFSEFGKDLYTALRGEDALIFTFVPECCRLGQVMNTYPTVVPLILDTNAKDGANEGHKLLSSFPTLDHIVNLSGDPALDIISKAYGNWKIQDFGENKTKPLISKMKDSGSRGLIFHSSIGV